MSREREREREKERERDSYSRTRIYPDELRKMKREKKRK